MHHGSKRDWKHRLSHVLGWALGGALVLSQGAGCATTKARRPGPGEVLVGQRCPRTWAKRSARALIPEYIFVVAIDISETDASSPLDDWLAATPVPVAAVQNVFLSDDETARLPWVQHRHGEQDGVRWELVFTPRLPNRPDGTVTFHDVQLVSGASRRRAKPAEDAHARPETVRTGDQVPVLVELANPGGERSQVALMPYLLGTERGRRLSLVGCPHAEPGP